MDSVINFVLLIIIASLACMAVFLKDLLRAAISLAFMSAVLAVLIYNLNSPYAAVFELSVVAGLITVLFVSTIAMTKEETQVREADWPLYVFPLVLLVFGLVDVTVMRAMFGATPAGPGPSPSFVDFGRSLWGARSMDILGQIAVIFGGVFGVLALFREKPKTTKEIIEAEKAKDGREKLW